MNYNTMAIIAELRALSRVAPVEWRPSILDAIALIQQLSAPSKDPQLVSEVAPKAGPWFGTPWPDEVVK